MGHAFTFLTSAPQSKAPTITIRKGGMLALNESALKMLGDEVAFVQLGYDETKKAIGLRAAGEWSTGCYRLRKQTKSQTRLVDAALVKTGSSFLPTERAAAITSSSSFLSLSFAPESTRHGAHEFQPWPGHVRIACSFLNPWSGQDRASTK